MTYNIFRKFSEESALDEGDSTRSRSASVTARRITLVGAILVVIAARVLGAIHTPEEVRRWAISTPKPKYPISARIRRVTGRGVFELWVVIKTGLAKGVKTMRSTGDAELDFAVIQTLQQWRFKPGVLPSIRQVHPQTKAPYADEYCRIVVPVNFSLTY